MPPIITAPEIPLTLGQPTTAAVGTGGIAYYSVSVPLPFSALYFSLTPQYGNSDLYVNTAAAGRPTPENAQYRAAGTPGADGLVVYSTDAAVRAACLRTSRVGSTCQFSLAVIGGEAASFILVASIDGEYLSFRRLRLLPAAIQLAQHCLRSSSTRSHNGVANTAALAPYRSQRYTSFPADDFISFLSQLMSEHFLLASRWLTRLHRSDILSSPSRPQQQVVT